MKLKPTTRVKRSRRVIFKEVDGVVYILDPRNSTIYTLNETASFIWQSLKTPRSIKELISLLTKSFKVGKVKAKTDLEDFISQYLEEELLTLG